ncbi:hypothetical protein IAU60_001854 [Kwoniella sp. DSM 27419]
MVEITADSLPGIKHKVIGLVSGGKDSCFNLMHCIANGHELVALATLTPEPGVDELDSHLYQSVGTHLLPLLARSMGLPLFTRVIKGKAVSKGPEYGSRLRGGQGSGEEGDETEDLTALLGDVLSAHPEATALASGAILSTYQRLRIEHVCTRLNLISLSYLWQSAQMPLLNRMISSGVEAVLMKVAGVGLGTQVVGKQLAEIMPLLTRLEATYGSHPAGEGGEYETLTLSTPLFSHRLKLTKAETIITDPEPYPVAYLRVAEAELEEKEGWKRPTVADLREMLGLDEAEAGQEGLDEAGVEMLEELRGIISTPDVQVMTLGAREQPAGRQPIAVQVPTSPTVSLEKKGRWFAASVEGCSKDGQDVGEELRGCFDAIAAQLQSQSLSLPLHATHITLLLGTMSDFLPANAVYKTYFGTSPPSRATVAVPLDRGRVRVEVVGFDDAPICKQGEASSSVRMTVGGRNGLHVQGLSYWAPANIGPYSQAVMVDSRLHLAGQIPLLPPSLTLPAYPSQGSPFPHQAVLALQHVSKIVEVMRSKNSTGGGWEGWVESAVGWWAQPAGSASKSAEGLRAMREAWKIWAEKNGASPAPVIFVQASELPKGALVEYQTNFHTGRSGAREGAAAEGEDGDDDDDDDDDELEVAYDRSEQDQIWWESSETRCKGAQGSRAAVFLGQDLAVATEQLSQLTSSQLRHLLSKAITMRIYHSCERRELEPLLQSLSALRQCYTLVPVMSVHDRDGKPASAALEVFGI